MKVILIMAISANGIIATREGSEEFLSHENWLQFVKLAKKVGCFMWGRKTYEAVMKWEGDYLSELKDVTKVIISSSDLQLKEGFTQAKSPEDALKILEHKGFSQAIITGGSITNSYFAKNRLIDEVIFNINPSIIGEGIPIFAPEDFELNMELVSFEKVDENIVELIYKVKR
jgi:dihydrofolate reductase